VDEDIDSLPAPFCMRRRVVKTGRWPRPIYVG
jgi:hypothetical protein